MQQQSTTLYRWCARAGIALAAMLLGVGAWAGTSLDKIVAAAEQRHQARVRRVEEADLKGRKVYLLRMQKDGRVWEIKVDAETGKEL